MKSGVKRLNRMARAVNFVWNFCNDRQKDALRWSKKWPTGFDLCKLTAGSSKELQLPATSINAICLQYERSRRQHRRPYLRYRGRRTLGWIPMKAEAIRVTGDAVTFCGQTYRFWKSREVPGTIKAGGSFSQDSRGRWYVNITVEVAEGAARPLDRAVGIDLGLKDLAVLSNGERIANPRHLAALAEKLAKAQRGRKKRLATAIHAKIEARRRDALHKASTDLVRRFDVIIVGDVNAAALAKTSMAKSVNDASWSAFRKMLAYKSIANGARYQEVSERFTTQACSCCGVIPASSPKGRDALEIRHWVCSDCGASHDRDVNAATNILARSGHRAPAEGVPA